VAFSVAVDGVTAANSHFVVTAGRPSAIAVEMTVPAGAFVERVSFGIGGLSGWGGAGSGTLTGVTVLFHDPAKFASGRHHFAFEWTPPGRDRYTLVAGYRPIPPPHSVYGSGGYTARGIAALSAG
jgi:hypothetical protein